MPAVLCNRTFLFRQMAAGFFRQVSNCFKCLATCASANCKVAEKSGEFRNGYKAILLAEVDIALASDYDSEFIQ